MQYFLEGKEVDQFNQDHIMVENITIIWHDFLAHLPQDLREEAGVKGLGKIVFHPIDRLLKQDKYRSMRFSVKDASEELTQKLIDYEYLIIVHINK